ncbi:hypothetical protein [Endozoicomonas sp. 2B-B]
MKLLYLSPVPWQGFVQRPHKFVEWFHKYSKSEVLWVEPYPTRLPNLADFRRISHFNGQYSKPTPSWIKLFKPVSLPIEPIPCIRVINTVFWKYQIDSITDFITGYDTKIVIGKPSCFALFIIKKFERLVSVYDAMDNVPAFYQGISRRSMTAIEQQVVDAVDTMWSSSSKLKKKWEKYQPGIKLIPNAFDTQSISYTRPRPNPGNSIVFGYLGVMATWFDWFWVEKLANKRPNDVIKLIGKIYYNPKLLLPKNVELLPPKKHDIAMKLISDFNVGLIPFKSNVLTDYVDPIKYYEYIGTGIPVISTNFGEMKHRSNEPGVFISKSYDDIEIMAKKASEFTFSDYQKNFFNENNCWESRFNSTNFFDSEKIIS